MVALLSGSLAIHSLLARVVPYRVSTPLLERLLGAPPEEHFPTHYDQCRAPALRKLLSTWDESGIVPLYKAGGYLQFSRPLERAYLTYENWAYNARRENLATHYVIWAVK